MQVRIPYGETTLTAELPGRTFLPPAGGAAKRPVALRDLGGAVSEALDAPLGMAPIEELVRPGSEVLIAFDDPTAPSYGPIRSVAIRDVLRRLERQGVRKEDIRLICANALHRKFRHDELVSVIGQDLVDEFGERLFCHDAEDSDNLVYLGQTAGHGYDVEAHRLVAESDLVVYVNAAHGRGFSGGWKSVCVGLSTFRSIRHHHTPDGMSTSVKDNRMHKVLDEMGAHLEKRIDTPIFKIDAIEATPLDTAHVFAGSVWETRKAAVEKLTEYYPPRRSLSAEKFDAVLYGVPDWSPYAIFSHMNPILTLISSGLGYLGGAVQALGKPGCTVIMVTPCPNRWDRMRHPSYPDVWENVLPETLDAYEIERRFTERYARHEEYIDAYRHNFAFHPVHGILATHPLKRLKHAGKVIVVGIEEPATAEHVGFEAADSVDEALRKVEELHGADYSIAYIEHPASTATKVTM